MIAEIVGVTLVSFGVRALVELFVESRYKAWNHAESPFSYSSMEEWVENKERLMKEASAKYPSRFYVKPWERAK